MKNNIVLIIQVKHRQPEHWALSTGKHYYHITPVFPIAERMKVIESSEAFIHKNSASVFMTVPSAICLAGACVVI